MSDAGEQLLLTEIRQPKLRGRRTQAAGDNYIAAIAFARVKCYYDNDDDDTRGDANV